MTRASCCMDVFKLDKWSKRSLGVPSELPRTLLCCRWVFLVSISVCSSMYHISQLANVWGTSFCKCSRTERPLRFSVDAAIHGLTNILISYPILHNPLSLSSPSQNPRTLTHSFHPHFSSLILQPCKTSSMLQHLLSFQPSALTVREEREYRNK